MRMLTVKRKWSLIECASRIRLYVQCHESAATHQIDGKNFKEYPLKNGKSVTAEIVADQETQVYVESSTMQAAYLVPAGADDVTLVAKPHYNLAQGNPFTIERE